MLKKKQVTVKSIKIYPLIAMLVLFLSCDKGDIPYPGDQALLKKFFSREDSFLSMASDPGNKDIHYRLGIISSYSPMDNVAAHLFIVWQRDLIGPGGFCKGYYYSAQSPGQIVDDIDEFYNNRTSDQVEVFRHIKGPWYLYYSSSN